jgi:hypothetical protein
MTREIIQSTLRAQPSGRLFCGWPTATVFRPPFGWTVIIYPENDQSFSIVDGSDAGRSGNSGALDFLKRDCIGPRRSLRSAFSTATIFHSRCQSSRAFTPDSAERIRGILLAFQHTLI